MTITELTPGTRGGEAVQRFEVFTGIGRRREWSDEEKARIVDESYSPDMSVCAVARRYGLSPSQLFTWRRLARERRQKTPGFAPMFVPAIVTTSEEPTRNSGQRSTSVGSASVPAAIEVEIAGATVRIVSGADSKTIAAVVRALRACS